MSFDPWAAATSTPGRKSAMRKKTLRLAGNSPTKVHTLIKLHDWQGKAIYVYNIVTGEMTRVDKPSSSEWTSFSSAGLAIEPPPRDHESTDAAWWCEYGKRQATALGLVIAE